MKRKAKPHEHEAELNIIPYLDVIMNLVIFMLAGMTVAAFQIINVAAPDVSEGPSEAPADTPPPEQKQDLLLNVSISPKGFYIAATGGVLPGEAPADPGAPPPDPNTAPPTIPLKSDGKYDYDSLTTKIVSIKKAFPNKSNVFIAADAKITYEVVIGTMDAIRGDAAHPLFPDVAFAALAN